MARSIKTSNDQLSIFGLMDEIAASAVVSQQINYSAAIVGAARMIVGAGCTLDKAELRRIMKLSFHGSDADGAWCWKDAYEALEVSNVLWLQLEHTKKNILSYASGQAILHAIIERVQSLPTHTKRSEKQIELQQFSTPITLGYIASVAAGITAEDILLEPSCGTGALAVWGRLAGAQLVLNEIDIDRAGIIQKLFGVIPSRHNAEYINSLLAPRVKPTVTLLNPPFSNSPNFSGPNTCITAMHLEQAIKKTVYGGRIVAITGNWFNPWSKRWKPWFDSMKGCSTLLMSAGVQASAYAKQGTTVETRIHVWDKVGTVEVQSKGITLDPDYILPGTGVLDLNSLYMVARSMPARQTITWADDKKPSPVADYFKAKSNRSKVKPKQINAFGSSANINARDLNIIDVEYSVIDAPTNAEELGTGIYEQYRPQRILVQAKPHPTSLAESAAMNSIEPPVPSYQPKLPKQAVDWLSQAQMESIIYAGEAHSQMLKGWYTTDKYYDKLQTATKGTEDAFQLRKGWQLGDGTGVGKGSQAAGIIMDNWVCGRKRAIWISKNAPLKNDAIRDWQSVGGQKSDIFTLPKLGEPIPDRDGILFLTYGTLKSVRDDKSRLKQIIDWATRDFDGVLIMDEAHGMGNAIGVSNGRGQSKPSQQGIYGLRLQRALPGARVVYVSATAATRVSNMAYAERLGIAKTGDLPFTDISDFISSIENGGVAAMEIVCRDLKALGLYLARTLSFDGIEYQTIETQLTSEQIKLYNTYADAFEIIHNNLDQAMAAAGITGLSETLNAQAKGAAYSNFESCKQRFFNHLLTSIKCPTMVKSIEQDLADGHAVVIQIVSTNEAVLQRRLAGIPADEYGDISVDVTPREYVLDYLANAFPTIQYEKHFDGDRMYSEVMVDTENNAIECQEAIDIRDRLIDKIARMDALPGALDYILHHFGHDNVAEVTGRSVRVLYNANEDRKYISKRPSSSNVSESQAFMDGKKNILIFSKAGGTGRSYHASNKCNNRKRRMHYLLENGWQADATIQGFGRTHRTNQASAPYYKLMTTNVAGEKRFISTIAKRLDSLGALTKGQRQTGGQGIFSAADSLEGFYANAALRDFFSALWEGRIEACSISRFEAMTGLNLRETDGTLKIDLPPLTRFLNRLLALRFDMQNELFDIFQKMINGRVEKAIADGTYECGVETIQADSLKVGQRFPVYTHPGTGSITEAVEIIQSDKVNRIPLPEAMNILSLKSGRMMVNSKSKNVAIAVPTDSVIDEKGFYINRTKMVTPSRIFKMTNAELSTSKWVEVDRHIFSNAWNARLEELPEYEEQRFFLLCGLLLPIWKSINSQDFRIKRLLTDDGQSLLGRVVLADNVNRLAETLGAKSQVNVTAEDIWHQVMISKLRFELPGGLSFKARTVEQSLRLELEGKVSDHLLVQLKDAGCFTEKIQWQLRIFVPADKPKSIPVITKIVNLLNGD